MLSICNILAYCTINTPITIKTNYSGISVEYEEFSKDGIKIPIVIQVGKDTCYLQVGNRHQFIGDLNKLESIFLEEMYKNNRSLKTTKKKKELSLLLEPYIHYYYTSNSVLTIRFYNGNQIIIRNKGKKLKIVIDMLEISYKLTLVNDVLGQYIHLDKGYRLDNDLKKFLDTFH